MSSRKIGVLALQGGFAKHIAVLHQLGVATVDVRTPGDLNKCSGLIIPGGESTTMLRQLSFIDLYHPLEVFAKTRPVFGTCAGLILMSATILSHKEMKSFSLLDITVDRNAYGRQVESFVGQVDLSIKGCKQKQCSAVFIRAPRIRQLGKEVSVLAVCEGEPVLVEQGLHLGASFHPELTNNLLIHHYFIEKVHKNT